MGRRWEWSLPVVAAYDVAGFPSARERMPETYRSLGELQNLGRCVPITGAEYQSVLGVDLNEITLHLSRRAQQILNLNSDDRQLRQELSRLVDLILQDIARAGAPRSGTYPMRMGPNYSELFLNLMQRWNQQNGLCALCDRPIPLTTTNKLLQISRDRTDSANKSYDWQNTRLTHLACNLGKSDASSDNWDEYIALIRQV
jgi:hypothetical protein